LGVDPALIQEFFTLSSHEKILAGVAVVTVVSIGVEKYFFGPPAPMFDYFGESNSDQFVHDNLLATRYHEIGHAMIDQLELSLLGQKKDAADVASVF
jgi:antirestriction protein ArdC